MNSAYVIFVLFVCTFFVCYKVEGRNFKLLSKKEDFELEEQLKLINKPAIKSIVTEDGNICDCVYFHEQPAFDHPLLQNYTLHLGQVKPHKVNYETRNNFSTTEINLESRGCPAGTVPIRRITKDDLIRERFASNTRNLLVAGDNSDAHYAVARTKAGDPRRYAGAGGFVAIYKPSISGSQYSASRFLLKNGRDSIEVGWRVDPVLYGDDKCHVYLRTIIKGAGCFGVRCPGFVITTNKFDIEGTFEDSVSVRGRAVREIKFNIIRDNLGNWVLTVGTSDMTVGHWPKSIFTKGGLTGMASYVEWGGEVSSPTGTPKPPMGSSYYPVADPYVDGLYHKITVADESGRMVDMDGLEPFADSKSYRVIYRGIVVYFGGPGGNL